LNFLLSGAYATAVSRHRITRYWFDCLCCTTAEQSIERDIKIDELFCNVDRVITVALEATSLDHQYFRMAVVWMTVIAGIDKAANQTLEADPNDGGILQRQTASR
jgi:hypothetical protein